MARANHPLVSFNRGLISPKALARVDTDRALLSAEIIENWVPSTRGPISLRPGTIYEGNTYSDTGVRLIPFISGLTDNAICEISGSRMRVWLGTDAHNLSLVSRPPVATSLTLNDTGWYEDNFGGGKSNAEQIDLVPALADYTSGNITVSASSEYSNSYRAWNAFDEVHDDYWYVGTGGYGDTAYLQIDFGQDTTVGSIAIKGMPELSTNASPGMWKLQGNHADTGSDASWSDEIIWNDTGTNEWSLGLTRQFSDTGTAGTWRYWRLLLQKNAAKEQDGAHGLSEWQLYEGAASTDTGQTTLNTSGARLNAGADGSIARLRKRVPIDTGDQGLEHGLHLQVTRGPVRLKVGSAEGDEDLIVTTSLDEGWHFLSFTPAGATAHVTLENLSDQNKFVGSLTIGDTGTIEIPTPWIVSSGDTGAGGASAGARDLSCIRHTQSGDIIYVACEGIHPYKIERRGQDLSFGRAWSVSKYHTLRGPFRPVEATVARIASTGYEGNVTLTSDVPLFNTGHTGALFKLTHNGQTKFERLGNQNATTTPVVVTGLKDTGLDVESDRYVYFETNKNGDSIWQGEYTVERSIDSEEFGFHTADARHRFTGAITDTGTRSCALLDDDTNLQVWYRVRLSDYTSGSVVVESWQLGSVTSGIFRITEVTDNQTAKAEVLQAPSDTGGTEDWQEGAWSDFRGYPTSVSLHEGRLCWAGMSNIWMSVSDDYANFDEDFEGDAGPISRTFGTGPVNSVNWLVSMQRLIAGTADAETVIRSSSFDEILTPSNVAARVVSSQGSAATDPILRDEDMFFVQRSGEKLYRIQLEGEFNTKTSDMTVLVPEVLQGGVVASAIQRQPDTRMHFVLDDGTVAIHVFEPDEETTAWFKWTGDTGTQATVEDVVIIPGSGEDAVFYVVRRVIAGTTVRHLEKWAKETQSEGDTGLNYLADCAIPFTDTGRNAVVSGLGALEGATVVAWSDDTGQANIGKDQSPDVNGVQTTYTVSSGAITLGEPVHHAVVGLPYKAKYKTTKMAYGAEGTPLAQMKRTDKVGLSLYKTHNNGLKLGNDTGTGLDPLPRMMDNGGQVDADKIYDALDEVGLPFPGLWDEDSRIYLEAKSPRPVTVLGMVPTVGSNEKV